MNLSLTYGLVESNSTLLEMMQNKSIVLKTVLQARHEAKKKKGKRKTTKTTNVSHPSTLRIIEQHIEIAKLGAYAHTTLEN